MTAGDLALLAVGMFGVFVAGVRFGMAYQARTDEERYTRRNW